jgi:hypothetical protein
MKIYLVLKNEYNGYGCDGVETWDLIFATFDEAKKYRDELLARLFQEKDWNGSDYLEPILEYDIQNQKTKRMDYPSGSKYNHFLFYEE